MESSIEPFVTQAFATPVPPLFSYPNHLLGKYMPCQNGNNYRSIGKISKG